MIETSWLLLGVAAPAGDAVAAVAASSAPDPITQRRRNAARVVPWSSAKAALSASSRSTSPRVVIGFVFVISAHESSAVDRRCRLSGADSRIGRKRGRNLTQQGSDPGRVTGLDGHDRPNCGE